jgi:hypothetical protein
MPSVLPASYGQQKRWLKQGLTQTAEVNSRREAERLLKELYPGFQDITNRNYLRGARGARVNPTKARPNKPLELTPLAAPRSRRF